MVSHKDVFFDYKIGPHSFFMRAKKQLESYDVGQPDCLFYAALELRFAIEARLYQYIEASCKQNGQSAERIKEYSATRLLRTLMKVDPGSVHPGYIKITPEQGGKSSTIFYRPVTRRLAQMHGQLGNLLHFTFFRKNNQWYLKSPDLKEKYMTLNTFRDFLEDVLSELEMTLGGTLSAMPNFTEFMVELGDEKSED